MFESTGNGRKNAWGTTAWLTICLSMATVGWAREMPIDLSQDVATGLAGASSLSVVDLDQDGRVDLLVSADSGVTWIRNTSMGTSTASLFGGGAPSDLTTADLDDDGDMDIALADAVNNRIAWLENDGSESFSLHVLVASALDASTVIALDVNRDGLVDLAFGSSGDGTVAWLENQGSGNFLQRNLVTNANGVSDALGTDIDYDGDVDLLYSIDAGATQGSVVLLRNNGNEIFQTITLRNEGAGIAGLGLADLDSDGDEDIAYASPIPGTVHWLENNRSTVFTFRSGLTGAANARRVLEVDFDRDGDQDLLVSSDRQVWWADNVLNSTGQTGLGLRSLNDGQQEMGSALALDLDVDGDVDVVGSDPVGDTVGWLENRDLHRSVSFLEKQVTTTSLATVSRLVTGDVDRDGDLDIVASPVTPGLLWQENLGDGRWINHQLDNSGSGNTRQVHIVDLDGDGHMDILNETFTRVLAFENDGDGTFTRHVLVSGQDNIQESIPVDFDGDGDLDVVAGTRNTELLFWLENPGSGWNFPMTVIDANIGQVKGLSATDYEPDGDVDIVAGNSSSIFVHLNEPGFPRTTVGAGAGSAGLDTFVVDLDQDGDDDILSCPFNAAISGATVRWYERLPNGSYTNRTLGNLRFGDHISAQDLDMDGDLDILVHGEQLEWYENDGEESFTVHLVDELPLGSGADAADVDGDGDWDLVSTNSSTAASINVHTNGGGHLALLAESLATDPLNQGTTVPLVAVTAVHRGQAGDDPLDVAELSVLWEFSEGEPLTTVFSVVESLRIFLDDGSGVFDGGDVEVAAASLVLDSGFQTAILPVGDPSVRLQPGESSLYFFVLQLESDAAAQGLPHLRATFRPEGQNRGQHGVFGLPLLLEERPAVTTGTLWLQGPTPRVDLNGGETGIHFEGSFRLAQLPAPAAAQTARIVDADSPQLTEMVVTLANRPDVDDELLEVDTSGTSVAADFSGGVLTLSGPASLADFETVLRTLVYRNVASVPTFEDRFITVVANDGTQLSETATAVLRSPLFGDGFESGNTSAWSSAAP